MRSSRDLIDIICWDRRIVVVPVTILGPTPTVFLLHPNLLDRNLALHAKQVAYDQAIGMGVLTEKEIIDLAIENGLWSSDNESRAKDLESRISDLNESIRTEKLVAKKRKLSKQIEFYQEELDSLIRDKTQFTMSSAEYMAHEHYVMVLLQRTAYSLDSKPIWPSDEYFYRDKKSYPEYVTFLANELVSEGLLPSAEIRMLARSGEWRVLWSSGRDNVESLFNRSAANMTINQKLLCYWSRIYDAAYEDPDRPDEEIFNDDDKFDVWFKDRIEKRAEARENTSSHRNTPNNKSKRNVKDHHESGSVIQGYYIDECVCGAKGQSRGLGESPRHANECKYGVYVPYTREEKDEIADQIYGRNNKNVREHLNKEQEAVAQAGLIEEHHLRNRRSRMALGSDQKIHKVKR